MGFLNAPPRVEFLVVAEGIGQTITPTGVWNKARFWLLEDRRLIWAYADAQGQLAREETMVDTASFGPNRVVFKTSGGLTYDFAKAPCNCGMGVVAYAQPVDDRVTLTRVVPPAWVSGL